MEQSFSEYIIKCKSLIATTRIDLNNNPNANLIIEANTPYELNPVNQKIKAGILMLHGLLDSPFEFRELGPHLQSQGFLVRSLLLPGHGTIPGALLPIDYQEWVDAVKDGIHSLQKEVQQIILLGYSTGASLALHHLLKNNTKIAGIILIVPPIKIYSSFAPIANLPSKLSKIYKNAAWFYKSPEETSDYAKYLSMPYNAIYQVYRLSQELRALNKPITSCPLLFIASSADRIVCPSAIINFFTNHTNPESRLLFYTNKPFPTKDKRIQCRPCYYPNQHIKNLSHICLPYSEYNNHYGKHGDCPYSSHTDKNNNTIYGEFLRDDLYINRWKLKLGLTTTRYERLTFNPDFTHMTTTILNFAEQAIA